MTSTATLTFMLGVLRDLFGWLCRHLTDLYPEEPPVLTERQALLDEATGLGLTEREAAELAGQFYPLPVSAGGCGRGCPCGALSEELA